MRIAVNRDTRAIVGADHPGFVWADYNLDLVDIYDVPDQDLSHIIMPHPVMPNETTIVGVWPTDVRQYTREELAQVIDINTGRSIDEAVHPLCGIEEQLGILRDQMVMILNALGLEPSEDFARFNEITIAEVEKARIEKEAL